MIGFYIEQEGMCFYWTGNGFSDDEEDMMLYTMNKLKQMILDNLRKLLPVRKIMQFDKSLTIDDIKVC